MHVPVKIKSIAGGLQVPETGVTGVMSSSMWALGTKLVSSGRAGHVFKD